jgi:hypothetical protein
LPIDAAWSGSPGPAPPPPPPEALATARGVHRRPPGLPVPPLRTRCPPSPCDRLSRPPTTTGTPSSPRASSRRRACPPPAWLASGEGNPGRVPTFTIDRSTRAVPSSSPAASPRVRRRLSPWPPTPRELRRAGVDHPATGWSRAAARPTSTRLEPVSPAYGGSTTGSLRVAPSRLACRARAVWRCRPAPSLSGLLPPFPAPPGSGCPQLQRSAATDRRRAPSSRPVR